MISGKQNSLLYRYQRKVVLEVFLHYLQIFCPEKLFHILRLDINRRYRGASIRVSLHGYQYIFILQFHYRSFPTRSEQAEHKEQAQHNPLNIEMKLFLSRRDDRLIERNHIINIQGNVVTGLGLHFPILDNLTYALPSIC